MKKVLLFLRKKFRTSSLSACSGFKNSHSSLEKQNLRICFKKIFLTFHTSPPRHDAKNAAALDPNFLWKSSLTTNMWNHSVNFLSQKKNQHLNYIFLTGDVFFVLILKKCESILILFPCCFLIRKMKYLPVNVLCCCKPAVGSKRSNPSAAPF